MSMTYKALQIEEDLGKGFMAVTVSGKLESADYDFLGMEVDRMVSLHGKIRVLIELEDFHGWTAGAAWEDAKMGFRHYSHIERMAVVGENQWEKNMTLFVKPFTGAELRYFDASDSEAALEWVLEKG